MGSGTSRGKKVAPACVTEITVSNRDENKIHSLTEDQRSFQPVKIPKFSNISQSQNRAQHDCHSEGHDSEFSADEDDLDEELDRVLAEYESPKGIFSKGKVSPKKSFIRSKTYGFCNFTRVHNERDFNSSPHLPRPAHCEKTRLQLNRPEEVNKKNNGPNFLHQTAHCPDYALHNGLLTNVVCVESDPRGDTASPGSPSVEMPVIQYDGSEEELMNTIEKEFS